MWINAVISISHLMVILNSSVNFYIYLVKLRIMHRTLANCCRQERKLLYSKTKRIKAAREEVENEIMANLSKEYESQEIIRPSTSNEASADIFMLSAISPTVPDIIQSSVSE